MEMPGRSVRYTIRLDENGRWFEIGETSSDGSEWRKFFEMTLTRVERESTHPAGVAVSVAVSPPAHDDPRL
jgi:hypothetical protein